MALLATFVGGWGHAEPLLPVVRLARERGHEVTFAGQRAILPRLQALGLATVELGPDTLATERLPLQPVDRELEREVMRDHFVRRFGRHRAPLVRELLARDRPHVLVCDAVDVGAIVAAEVEGVPCVTVDVIAAGRLTAPDVIGAAWDELRAEHGLAPDPAGERLAGELMLAPFPASFRDPSLGRPARWRPVRPDLVAPAPPAPEAPPFVYATLGTVFNVESGDLLQRLVDGLAAADVDALLTVGPAIEPAELAVASRRVRVEQFVPLRDVLPRCAAVVCHGGSGTLLAALASGVPVVVLPMGADQPDNADRVGELGCGVVLDPLEATPDSVAAAVREVLGHPSFAAAARRLAAEAAAQPLLTELPEVRTVLRP